MFFDFEDGKVYRKRNYDCFTLLTTAYVIWQWLKNDKPLWWGVIGGIVLVLYGVVATHYYLYAKKVVIFGVINF